MKMINRYGGLALAGCLVVLILAAANTAHAASDLDQALTSLARQLVPQGGKPLAVAVADPAGPGKHLSKFSLAVSRGLGHALIKAGIGTVLERKRLNDILEEQQLELSGALDVNLKTMAPLHKKQGVQGLVFSTLDDREGGLEMAARLVEVETGGTLASGRGVAGKDPVDAGGPERNPAGRSERDRQTCAPRSGAAGGGRGAQPDQPGRDAQRAAPGQARPGHRGALLDKDLHLAL